MRALTKLLACFTRKFVGSFGANHSTRSQQSNQLFTSSPIRISTRSGVGNIRASINDYIPKTLHDNFALLDKYPNYVFNFSGANRYRMMKEYWPADYARLKQYVAAGRWFPAGLVDGRGRRQRSFRGVDLSSNTLRQSVFSA